MKTLTWLLALELIVSVSLSVACTHYYVNAYTGNDAWDGLTPTYEYGNHGPKATVQDAVNTAQTDDVIHLAECAYNENATINKTLVITSIGTTSICSITVSNGSRVSLDGNIEVLCSLTLDGGVITTDDSGGIAVSNPNASAVVINSGCILGRIRRLIPAGGTGSYLFTDANSLLILNGSQPTLNVSVLSVLGQPPSTIQGHAINRYYRVTVTGGSLHAGLRLAYNDSELNGIVEPNLISFRRDSTSWEEMNGTLDPLDNYFEMTGVLMANSVNWTLGDVANPLPIQLASFTAFVNNGNSVALNWRTLTETNNFGFYIQQSNSPSSNFTDVPNSFVPGHGTTIEPHDYSWTHVGVLPGTYYYRLKQIDLDGSIHFSDAREVTVLLATGVTEMQAPTVFGLAQNYPNPFNPSTQIQFTVEAPGYTTLTVFDVLGKEVGKLYTGMATPGRLYSVSFDASGITNGTYFYKLVNGAQTSLKKMLLLK